MSLSERDLADAALKFWPDPTATSEIDRAHWADWLAQIAPESTRHDFADFHAEYWAWITRLRLGRPPSPAAFLPVWGRGLAKSTSTELGIAYTGALATRRYWLYVCASQEKADEHVSNIATILESGSFRAHYPQMGERLVGLYGNAKGWRRNRLRTATGFTVDALGLDTAARGAKVDDQRPDGLAFDDVDDINDSVRVVRKKERLITRSILPAGSVDVGVVFPQNPIHAGSVMNRLITGEVDWLTDRQVSGPIPAVANLEYESTGSIDLEGRIAYRITGGTASWSGMDLEECERRLNLYGPDAFVAESQNDVTTRRGALLTPDVFNRNRRAPGHEVGHGGGLIRTVVGVDPTVSDSPNADECGIIVAGKGADGHGYVLEDASMRAHPDEWAKRVVFAAHRYLAPVVAESNQGGELVRSAIWAIDPTVHVVLVPARHGKELRAQPVALLYINDFVHHLGRFPRLEAQWCSWVPGEGDSPDRVDADVYALAALFPSTGVVTQSAMVDGRSRR